MLQHLGFEFCKESGESVGMTLYLSDDGYYYLKNSFGFRGIYICDADHVKNYRLKAEYLIGLSGALERLKLYSLKKAYPSDYIPGNHLIGCDEGSWSLDYKESEKRITRHIHGKGDFPPVPPFSDLLHLLDSLFPEVHFKEWLKES